MSKSNKAPFSIQMMRIFFQISGNLFPQAASRMLWNVMATPKKRSLKPPHIACLEKAEKLSFKVNAFPETLKVINISVYKWGESDKKILLVHGWESKALDYYKLIPQLVEKGYEVYSIDLPAHGNSEGKQSNIIEFKRVLYQFTQQFGTPYAIIGHSMGATASAFMLANYPVTIQKLILIANPIIVKNIFDGIFTYLSIPAKLRSTAYRLMSDRVGVPIESLNLNDLEGSIKAENIYLLYDKADQIISVKDIENFLSNSKSVKGQTFEGKGHNGLLKDAEVAHTILGLVA